MTSESNKNRVESHDLTTQLVSMAMMLYSIPNILIPITDAVCVFPGLGESWRVKHAIKLYENNVPLIEYLMVAGHNPSEKFFEDFSMEGLRKDPFNLIHVEGLITTAHATNTVEQCQWVCSIVKEHGLTGITLTASPYHLLRAYLTLLKTFLKEGFDEIPLIIPSPAIVPPHEVIPETGINAWGMSPAEIMRIPKYQELGDVATFEEFKQYLKNVVWQNMTTLY